MKNKAESALPVEAIIVEQFQTDRNFPEFVRMGIISLPNPGAKCSSHFGGTFIFVSRGLRWIEHRILTTGTGTCFSRVPTAKGRGSPEWAH